MKDCGFIQKNMENCCQSRNKLVEIIRSVRSICVYFGSQEARKVEK